MSIVAPLPVEVRAEYRFTEEEKKQLGADLAAKIDRQEGLESERKSAMSDFKERLDRATSEIKKISSNLNLGYEFRSYTCRVSKNYKLKIKEYYCVHTGKLIDTKKFDPQDFQQTFDDAPADGKKIKNNKDIQPSLGQGIKIQNMPDIKTKDQIKREKEEKLKKEATNILKKNGFDKNGKGKSKDQ